MTTRSIRMLLLAALALVAGIFAAPASASMPEIRGMWVTRWDYVTQADITRAMREMADLGITDVFWQVRGQADAYYDSDLEPWGEHLFREPQTSADWQRGPGFDPLAVAVREAHANSLRLHAWVNAMPLWKDKTPPQDRSHAYWSKPGWRLQDSSGQLQPLNDHYVIVNPVLPEVREHLAAVASDIATRYDIDGLHLDYIRFVTDAMDTSKVYPADAYTRLQLDRRTGSDKLDTAEQRKSLRLVVRDAVTETVHAVRDAVKSARPDAMLTAAIWRRPELARDLYEQDAAAWLRDGLLDAAMPMIYTSDRAQFVSDIEAWRKAAPGAAIVPGIGSYKHEDGATTVEQISLGGENSFALFAYSSYFKSRAPGQDHGPAGRAERERRRLPVAATMGE